MKRYRGLSLRHALRSVGKGWHWLIILLYVCKPFWVAVIDVKEKFGGLRFYLASSPGWYFNLVERVCDASDHICEYCGRPGTKRYNGWWKTLCNRCDRLYYDN